MRWFAFLLAFAAAGSAFAQPESEPSSTYFRDWLVCGPFPDPAGRDGNLERTKLDGLYIDYLADAGGEAETYPDVGDVVAYGGAEYRWREHAAPDDAIDLDAVLGKDFPVVGYAYTTFFAEADRGALMAVGSNDDVRVWLNGEEVHDQPGPRGLRLDEDLVPVLLRDGANTLLVKVEERGNAWGFSCRFLPFDFERFLERTSLFRFEAGENGGTIHVNGPSDLLRAMVTSVELSVANTRAPGVAIWTMEWDGEASMEVDLPKSSGYEQFTLNAVIRTDDDKTIEWSTPFSTGAREEHSLFENGKSDYVIAVADDASPSEQWAAKELQHWLEVLGGTSLSIRNPESIGEAPALLIGFNDRVSALLDQASAPADTDESFHYRNFGRDIAIWGGRDRGTMYGVMAFLEREFGVRFYTPSVTVVPERTRYAFDYLEHAEAPGIRVRNDFYFEAFDPTWAARNRANGAMGLREQPGGVEPYWRVHTFYPVMSPEEFFEPHPEYFSLIDGERIYERAQLCLTNPEVLRIFTERMKNVMREHPQYRIYSVSQNDWRNPCQCDNCQAIATREESESGPMLWFVNQIAEAIEDEFPDKYIGTLAYQYTRKPPKTITPRENVVIRFCSIECCFAHPFTECPENASFVADMEGWAAIAPHIYVWDYVVNFSHYVMPYPNFRVLQPNIQFFRDHKAIGIMEQGAYQSRGGEFAELRAYVIAKLLWDPEADVDAIVDDFMYGYYGRSGQYIRAYFDLLHNSLTPDTHIHLGLRPDDPLFTDALIHEADTLFDRAEAVADNADYLARVELARLPLLYLKCRRDPDAAHRDGSFARFSAIADRERVTYISEASITDAFRAEMETSRPTQ